MLFSDTKKKRKLWKCFISAPHVKTETKGKAVSEIPSCILQSEANQDPVSDLQEWRFGLNVEGGVRGLALSACYETFQCWMSAVFCVCSELFSVSDSRVKVWSLFWAAVCTT